MKLDFVNIETAIDEYLDLTDYKGRLDKASLLKWANDVATKLTFDDSYLHKVVLLDVKEHQARVPSDCHQIIQVAFKNGETKKVRRTEVVEWVQQTYDGTGCEYTITKNCPKCHQAECECEDPGIIIDVDRLWQLSHPETQYAWMKHFYRHGGLYTENHMYRSLYSDAFYLIKAAQHNFFNADYHIKGCLNLDAQLLADTPIEYRFEPPYFTLNVKEGQILLSYFAYRVDDKGYRFLPNHPYVFEAVSWAIEEKMLYREYRRTFDSKLLQASKAAKQEKEIAMGRARELLSTPDFNTWWPFIENMYVRMYPYYTFYQDMGRKQPDRYDIDMTRLERK